MGSVLLWNLGFFRRYPLARMGFYGTDNGNESMLKYSPNHLVRRIPSQEVVQTAINIRKRVGHCHKHSFICSPSQAAASLLVLQPSGDLWPPLHMPKPAKNKGLPNADQEALHCRWRAPASLEAQSRKNPYLSFERSKPKARMRQEGSGDNHCLKKETKNHN